MKSMRSRTVPMVTIFALAMVLELSHLFSTAHSQQIYTPSQEVSRFSREFNLSSQLHPGEALLDLETLIDIIARERARLLGRLVSPDDYRVVSYFLCIRFPNDPPKPRKTQEDAAMIRPRLIQNASTNLAKREAIIRAIRPNVLRLTSAEIRARGISILDLLDVSILDQ